MRRREFITVLGGAAAAWPVGARAQQPAKPAIGFLHSLSPDPFAHRLRAFRQGLKETGYVEGENIVIEYRWAEGRFDRLPVLAEELVRRQVAVIVAPNTNTTLAVKAATTTIPIVFAVGKRLELLHELVPRAARVAVLVNPSVGWSDRAQKELDAGARALGLQIQILNATSNREIDAAFAFLLRERVDALFVTPGAFFNSRRVQLATMAARHAVPMTSATREIAEAGGLMSYGPDIADAWREVGVYTGRILKGAKPADLPVVQSTKFELVINAQTAKALGLEVPPQLLARADEVIE